MAGRTESESQLNGEAEAEAADPAAEDLRRQTEQSNFIGAALKKFRIAEEADRNNRQRQPRRPSFLRARREPLA